MSERAMPIRARGRCLCGAVTFEVRGPLRQVVACHCDECRRWTGSFFNATAALRANVKIGDNGSLAWYRSSPSARRASAAYAGPACSSSRRGRIGW